MDFKSMVNKESFKAILHHHLKSQVRAKFGNSILKSIQAHSENNAVLSDSIIDSVGNNISQTEECKEFVKTFLNSLNNLFEDKDKYIPKEENPGTISQCSSASSVNTSIDYISFEQFQDIIHTLSNGINAEKLEALETFSRLPSLEHITKQTLWPAIENGLQNALLSNVSFLKEASLKVYTKMLSSSEPKVVQESFNSLIKHLLQNLLPTMNQNVEDFINKCKSVVEILAVLNRFLQNIPNHWLRYPQPIIEDITIQSISILSFGSRSCNIFPIWLCIALCDKKSKWLKNLLYGHVSRAFLLDALLKDNFIIKYTIKFCENFNSNGNSTSWSNKCCQKFAEVSEITHIICFLSYLLQYSQGRELFSAIYSEDETFSWLNVLDLIMKCAQKLSLVTCLNCSSVVFEIVSKLWYNIWSCDTITVYSDSLIKILLYFNDIENLSMNGLNFIIQCLYHTFNGFDNIPCSEEVGNMFLDFMYVLLKHLATFSYDFPDISLEESKLFNSSLMFINRMLTCPSYLFINVAFIKMFSSWCMKIHTISKALTSSYSPGMKNASVLETERNICYVFISMLQKSNSIVILHDIDLFEVSINVLLENMLDDIKTKISVCSRDVSLLSNALNSSYFTKSFMNKSIAFKLASVVWQLETGDLENLPKVKSVLQILIPSIFPSIVESEILLDLNCENDKKLFHYVILFPSITKQEFVMFEEYNVLALQVISILTCSILSSCYLQAKFKLSDSLFELQSHHYNENGEPLIDAISVIQNHILVKLYVVGGSKEKVLPPESLIEIREEYNYPFFKNYPVPDVYYQELSFSGATDIDITYELNGENLRDIFLEYTDHELLSIDVISQILKASINVLEPVPTLSRTLNFVCLEDVGHIVLHDEIMFGLDMAKRYGKILNLVSPEEEKMIERLLKAGKCLLSAENRLQMDIFIATLCLIFRCDIQTSWLFLETFAKSSASLFIWYERILQAVEQNEKYITVFNIIMEHCDVIVKKTLPFIYSALQISGILPSVLFKYWTMHCYWNYLDFNEIAQFILITVIFGGDFALYFFVSVLRHMKNVILEYAHTTELFNVLKQNNIKGYKIQNYMNFMLELEKTFHSKISKSISDVLDV